MSFPIIYKVIKKETTRIFQPECIRVGVSKFFDRTYEKPNTIPNNTN